MTIEFIKDTDFLGRSTWYTKVNGSFETGSLSNDEQEAKDRFDKIVNVAKSKIEVLETVNL